MKRFIKLFSILLTLFVLVSCKNNNKDTSITEIISTTNKVIEDAKDINIIYTTDVHCGIEGNIGYSGISAYKKT